MAYTEDQYRAAGQWIQANLDKPALVAAKAAELGLTTQDLLKSAQTVNPNITQNQVNDYFRGGNIDYNPVSERNAAAATWDSKFNGLQSQYTGVQQQYAGLQDQFATTSADLRRLQEQYDALLSKQKKPGGSGGGIVGGGVVDDGSTFNPGGSGATGTGGVVYGPDGTQYSSPAAAVAAGVTNFTYTKPAATKPAAPGLINGAEYAPNLPSTTTGSSNPGGLITGTNQQLFNMGAPRVRLPGGVPNPFAG